MCIRACGVYGERDSLPLTLFSLPLTPTPSLPLVLPLTRPRSPPPALSPAAYEEEQEKQRLRVAAAASRAAERSLAAAGEGKTHGPGASAAEDEDDGEENLVATAQQAEQQQNGGAGDGGAGFTLRIPDAIDPAAFAKVVAQRSRINPPRFHVPQSQQTGGRGGARPSVAAGVDEAASASSDTRARADKSSTPQKLNAELELVTNSLLSHSMFSALDREACTALALQMRRLEHPEGTRGYTI